MFLIPIVKNLRRICFIKCLNFYSFVSTLPIKLALPLYPRKTRPWHKRFRVTFYIPWLEFKYRGTTRRMIPIYFFLVFLVFWFII
jgi:hypothetical protein